MSRVITFSRVFPNYHPKAGKETHFVEGLLNSVGKVRNLNDLLPGVKEIVNDFILLDGEFKKNHTIRSGKRWKAGDYFSPRVWSGKPYKSKMIAIAPDMEVKKTWDFDLENNKIFINKKFHCSIDNDLYLESLAINDGLKDVDLLAWFKYPNPVKDHQIICWNENINY